MIRLHIALMDRKKALILIDQSDMTHLIPSCLAVRDYRNDPKCIVHLSYSDILCILN